MNCWDYNKCGREIGGDRAAELGVCPAYPDHGRDCAHIAGTFCGGKVQGLLATKLSSCLSCSFYNSEHHLKDMKSLLRIVTVVDQTAESIVVTDTLGDIVYVNPAFTRITGYAQEEVLGKNPRILKSGRHDIEFYRNMWKMISGEGVWKGRITDRHKNGSIIEIESTITPIRDHNGNISSYVAINRDVTELVALENQLRQAQQLQSIGSLAAGIAHEINTPIQFVGDNVNFLSEAFHELMEAINRAKAASTMIASSFENSKAIAVLSDAVENSDLSYLETEIPKAIEQTLQGVERVSTIVRAMREFSHSGTGEKKEIDINKAIETTLTIAESELKHVAMVELDLDSSLSTVLCYPGPFNQVMLNLIVNAAHTIAEAIGERRGEKGTIRVRTQKIDGEALISISDTGTGISKEIQDRIFDPFFTTKAVGKGTGQGLAIAHSAVTKHGGTITFETEEGVGTTFHVRLPITSIIPIRKGDLEESNDRSHAENGTTY